MCICVVRSVILYLNRRAVHGLIIRSFTETQSLSPKQEEEGGKHAIVQKMQMSAGSEVSRCSVESGRERSE